MGTDAERPSAAVVLVGDNLRGSVAIGYCSLVFSVDDEISFHDVAVPPGVGEFTMEVSATASDLRDVAGDAGCVSLGRWRLRLMTSYCLL